MSRFARATRVTRQSPSAVTIVLGVLVAALQVANQVILTGPGLQQWRDAAAMVLTLVGVYGITPLFGPSLTALLHWSAQVLLVIGIVLSAANAVLTIVSMSVALHAVLTGVVTLLGSVVFGAWPPVGTGGPPFPPAPGPATPVGPGGVVG